MSRAVVPLLLLLSSSAPADVFSDHLRRAGRPPVEYVLARLDDHRVVILGESHWGRRDTELVAALVPHLRARGAVLAMEFFSYENQPKLDRLVASPAWDEPLANEILRDAEWSYVQYRDVLKAAWEANRRGSDPPLEVLAIGPPRDFRAKKIGYDDTMARRVLEAVARGRRVLAYCGMHHAFTRYLQVERSANGRATEFMDRFGNVLWRKHGQDVFLVALHKPDPCGPASAPMSVFCAPFGGAIDCAGAAAGRPVGFDVVGTPVAETKFPESSFYAAFHPHLRFADFTDGYVWTGPVDELPLVDLIPLAEAAPGDEKKPEAVRAWEKEAESLAHPLKRRGMADLPAWRSACPAASAGGAKSSGGAGTR